MRHVLLMPLVALAACATVAPPATTEPVVPQSADTCRNDALARFTGQPATAALGQQMLAVSGARVLRWVPRGMMVTMDYRGDRLTVALDEANRVERARCG